MNVRTLLLFFLLLSLASCQLAISSPAANYPSLTVFAAASLTEAFTDLGVAFKDRHPGTELIFNFAGSQQLAQQLAQGAPADVFASANQAQIDAAIEAGRINNGDSRVFARNKLVVIYPKENPAGLTGLIDLEKPGTKLVLAAKEVPAGNYALQFLEKASQSAGYNADFKEKVISNVVSYEENVRSVYSKVALGEADAGIVYATDVPKGNPDGVGVLEIPPDLNVIADYPIATINDSSNSRMTEDFISFVLSAEGQEILTKYGFIPAR
jgi:molybdate transport system substrate-binding protein